MGFQTPKNQNGPIFFDFMNSNMLFIACRLFTMLDWREREHEDVDLAVINHQPSIDALKACDLYKYWAIPGMRAQVDFLEWLVERWNIQDQ